MYVGSLVGDVGADVACPLDEAAVCGNKVERMFLKMSVKSAMGMMMSLCSVSWSPVCSGPPNGPFGECLMTDGRR